MLVEGFTVHDTNIWRATSTARGIKVNELSGSTLCHTLVLCVQVELGLAGCACTIFALKASWFTSFTSAGDQLEAGIA
jgi:hypothetical protein